MIEVLEALQWWQWWVFAMVLVIVETLLPSGILYGMGVAAFVVGAGMAGNVEIAVTLQAQIGGFLGMSIVFGWISRALRNRMLAPWGPDPEFDSRPTQPLTPPRPAPVEANPPAPQSEPPLNLKNAAPPAPKPAAKLPAAKKSAAAKPTPKPTAKPVAKPRPASPPEPDFVGGIYTIWSPITGGTGSIKIKGTDYALVGPNLSAGSRIKVVAVKNQILKVEATG